MHLSSADRHAFGHAGDLGAGQGHPVGSHRDGLFALLERNGDVMADYPDIEMPKIDKKKDNLLILLTVLSVYLIQLIGYFVVFKLFK